MMHNPKIDEHSSHDPKRYSIDTHLFIGFAVGLLLAILFRWSDHRVALMRLATEVAYPIGCMFVRVLFVFMAPFIFFSVALAVASLRHHNNGLRSAVRLATYYVLTTVIAITIGQVLVTYFEPGKNLPHTFFTLAAADARSDIGLGVDALGGIFSPIAHFSALSALTQGKMTMVYVISLCLGALLACTPMRRSSTFIYFLRTCKNISSVPIEQSMRLAPAAIAALTLGAICRIELTWASGILEYLAIVLGGLSLQMFVVYPLALIGFSGYSPWQFFRRARPAILAAFFSSSSNVVLPVTTRTLQSRFGIPESISSISVAIGANFNLDGTALFEAVAVVFLAQVFRIDFTLFDHLSLLAFVLVTSVGLPGVPGSAIPILATCLATLGIPVEGLGLIIGVDGLLVMFRSAVNTTGDMVGAVYLARKEGVVLDPRLPLFSTAQNPELGL
jgi:Na+/H+-dicarboxylate symporter